MSRTILILLRIFFIDSFHMIKIVLCLTFIIFFLFFCLFIEIFRCHIYWTSFRKIVSKFYQEYHPKSSLLFFALYFCNEEYDYWILELLRFSIKFREWNIPPNKFSISIIWKTDKSPLSIPVSSHEKWS